MSVPEAVNVTAAPAALVAGVVMFPGAVNDGPLLVTVTVNDPGTLSPLLSVTVQFTVVVPIEKVDPDVALQTAAIGPCSRSLPIALNVTAAPAALVAGVVMFAGGANVGALLVTVTENEVVALSPPLSVTVQLTVVVPTAKVEPDTGTHAAGSAPSSTSVPDTAKVAAAPRADVAGVVMSAGGASAGGLFTTVTVNDLDTLRPPESVTEHETVVVPIAKVAPDAGEHDGVRGPSPASFAVAVKFTAAPAALVANVVRFSGTVNSGGVLQNAGFDAEWMVMFGNTEVEGLASR